MSNKDWPLWCFWCDKRLDYGMGKPPLIVCEGCFEKLDRLDALMGRMPRSRDLVEPPWTGR